MFQAFIDESGNDPKEFAFVMAAWVASNSEWKRFTHRWQAEIRKKPAIKYFKHYEAKSRSGQFDGWSKTATNAKIASLAKVIVSINVYGMITGMRNEVLTRLLRGAVPSPKQLRSVLHMSRPYDFSFHSMVSLVFQRQLELKRKGVVDFVFDEGDASFKECAKMYRRMREMFPPKIKSIAGNITTADDKIVAPLQAADLLGGQVTTNIKTGHKEYPFRLLSKHREIAVCLIRWGEDPVLTNFAETIALLNAGWDANVVNRKK